MLGFNIRVSALASLFVFRSLYNMRWAAATLTRFELDPHSGIILDLLDHLSISANDDAYSKPRHCHLNKHTARRWCLSIQYSGNYTQFVCVCVHLHPK